MGPKSPAPAVASRTPRAQHDRRLIILSNGKLSIDDLWAPLDRARFSVLCRDAHGTYLRHALDDLINTSSIKYDKNIFPNFACARDYKIAKMLIKTTLSGD